MRRELSVYLDMTRIMAAFLVFMGHANHFTEDLFGKAGAHASEAVAVFFVLSGFVITFVSKERAPSLKKYVIARIVRIYSVAIPAIICALICNVLINHQYIQSMFQKQVFDQHNIYYELVSSLLFSGEFWFDHVFVGGNEPYWSIGFEVWYYVLFGIFWFSEKKLKFLSVLLISGILGPKIIIYFPLWGIGVVTYHIVRKLNYKNTPVLLSLISSVFLFLVSVLVCILLKLYIPLTDTMYADPELTVNSLYNWIYYTAVGFAFALTIIGVNQLAAYLSEITRHIEAPVRWIAGGTFTLYLTHQPILMSLASALRELDNSLRIPLIILGALALVTMLAELGERRKSLYSLTLRKWMAIIFKLSRSTRSDGRFRYIIGFFKRL